MNFVLSGVETQNKGAELMLYAILQEIERKYPDSDVYLPVDSVRQGLAYISTSLNLHYKPIQVFRDWATRNHIKGVFRRLHIPDIIWRDIYYVKGTDYLIDGSGFHYSDVWNHSHLLMQERKLLMKVNKRHGVKIVLMPQAFGPLQSQKIKDGLAEVDRYADIIMVRDNVSMTYLEKSALLSSHKVKRFTDYTSLVEPVIPAGYEHLYDGVCIIPNGRLFDKGNYTFEEYLTFVQGVIKIAKKYHKVPYLLNHEGVADTEIANQIIECMEEPIDFVDNLNALEVKGIISTAYLVVSSRFHGLASSLNTLVPCLATGWSHKYAELFHDYDIENTIIDFSDCDNAIDKVAELLEESANNAFRKHLSTKVPKIKENVRKMWDEIWAI